MVTNKKETEKNTYDTLIKGGIGLLLVVAGATGSNIDRFWITPEELDAKLEKYVTKEEFLKGKIDTTKELIEPAEVETKTKEIKNLLKLSNGSGIGEQ